MKDSDRFMQMLQNAQNDAVVITNMLLKYDYEGEAMGVLGAAFTGWCDAYKIPKPLRVEMLHKLTNMVATDIDKK